MPEEVRLLCVSDIHGRAEAAKALVSSVERSELESLDAVVVAGDIGSPQREDAFYLVIKELVKLGKPVFYVRGNWDTHVPSGIVNEDPLVADLEFVGPVELKGVTLVGHSTSNLRPYKGVKHPLVLVTHYPPFSILDKGRKVEAARQSPYTGLPEINYLVSYYKPVAHVFGHCHALGGIDVKHGGVLYVNVSRLDRLGRNGEIIGNYALLSVDKSGRASVKWRFVNGVWKKCSHCGRKVHLPPEWSMCRKCASRFELRFQKLDRSWERFWLTIANADGERILRESFYVPVHTLKDEESYNDFVDYLMVRKLREVMARDGSKLLLLSKDKVIEYYSEDSGGVIPFSEYLFSCREEKVGRKVCLLMKLFALDKRTKVLWKIREGALIEAVYVLVKEGVVSDRGLLDELRSNGFHPLLFKLERVQEAQAEQALDARSG